MTLQELYQNIGGDYALALRCLRVERLIDKHIRKYAESSAIDNSHNLPCPIMIGQ